MDLERQYPSTIAGAHEHEFVEKKSRFITHLFPVTSVSAADAAIAGIKKSYWDARHNCSAMVTGVLGDQARSSDDGEPSGTAGVPMFEVLRRRELTDVVAIVTRYFGGIKLGAGGLVRAYSTAVSEALDTATILGRAALRQAQVAVPHADAGRIEHMLRQWADQHGATWGEVTYGREAVFEVWVPGAEQQRLRDDVAAVTAGARLPEFGEVRIVDVPA